MKCILCGKDGTACFETYLCTSHGADANKHRDAKGLTYAPWPDVVRCVTGWIHGLMTGKAAGGGM